MCIELLHVILPGARQLKKFRFGRQIHETTTTKELERSPEAVDTVHDEPVCKRVLVWAFMGHPHAASALIETSSGPARLRSINELTLLSWLE